MYKSHLFICTNAPETPGKCGHQKSLELWTEVKAKMQGTPDSWRVNKAGCLGSCEKGISAVLYPEGKWFYHLKSTDAAKLVEELQQSLKEEKSNFDLEKNK